MHHRKFAMVTSLLLVAAFLISACAPSVTPTPETPTSPPSAVESTPTTEPTKEAPSEPTPTPTLPPQPTPCAPDQEKPSTWVCAQNNRDIVFSAVPTNVAVFMFAYDEAQLLKADRAGFGKLLFIAGDFRFIDKGDQTPITNFTGNAVTIQIPLTPAELDMIHGYKTIYLVQIEPDKKNVWKPLVTKLATEVATPFVSFQFEVWGVDPPTGLGVGN
jgi:hypothetical protein